MIDNSKTVYDAIGLLRKSFGYGRCIALKSAMDAPELSAVALLSDWYVNQKIGDANPFEINVGETPSSIQRKYASNFTNTVRIAYFHAGRKHALHLHVKAEDAQSIYLGQQLVWDAQKEFIELILINYGFTDFTILDWSIRMQDSTVWLPVQNQTGFDPTPGTLSLGTYTGLSSSGYARLEGASVNGHGLGVRSFMALQGLCFPPSLQSLTDARLTGSELVGLDTRITALNTPTEGSVILESICGTNVRWKNYLNVGYSASARKAARRG